ncbi:hypothetical protein [Halospina sp. K52047b]|uniref:hypothetical protein n=1 Tax=Halospina sp. K52047b TaxID=2614160 RepID=UPI00124A0DA3|nr:hypothetical protein [Halospina sp. K52047b]KAA8984558.1 hypothetical protein F3089_04215 [Halospina sp. K52047b]
MADERTLQNQIAGLGALKERLSEQSFARNQVRKLHSAAEALHTIATSNDGSAERARRLSDASKRYLDAIKRTKGDLQTREVGGKAALSEEFSQRVGLQADRYANEIAQTFGRADQGQRIQWLSRIAEDCDGRSLAALYEAPEFVTGLDRDTLAEFRGVMEEKHTPDIAAKRQTFNADVEAAQSAIDMASQIAEAALSIEDVDSAIAARDRANNAEAQLLSATAEDDSA